MPKYEICPTQGLIIKNWSSNEDEVLSIEYACKELNRLSDELGKANNQIVIFRGQRSGINTIKALQAQIDRLTEALGEIKKINPHDDKYTPENRRPNPGMARLYNALLDADFIATTALNQKEENDEKG